MSKSPILINLIGNSKRNTGIGNDMDVFMKEWRKYSLKHKYKTEFRVVDYRDYKCQYANINVYFENLNAIFIPYANYNIFIPNQEYFYTINNELLTDIDEIWCKTQYSKSLFEKIHCNVKYLSWTTFLPEDRIKYSTKNRIRECLLIAGKSKNKNADFVAKHWKPSWPNLHIYYQQDKLQLNHINQDNIIYHTDFVEARELSKIQNKYWYHICVSSMEGFGHYINEARECGAYIITTKGSPMREFKCNIEINAVKKRMKDRLGCRYNILEQSFEQELEKVFEISESDLIQLGKRNRNNFIQDYENFNKLFFKNTSRIISMITKQRKPPILMRAIDSAKNTSTYPDISIVTVTKNREKLFPLIMDGINKMDYPHHHMEWIIVEDGDENVKDIVEKYCNIPTNKIKYIRSEGNIGQKRNIGVENSSHKYIFMFDDDDCYRSNYIKYHLALFKEAPEKQCHYCSTIGVFHLNKMYSMINSPPMTLAPEERVSEATLVFNKDFWIQQHFPELNIAEGCGFLKGRISKTIDLSWEPIFVSFLHEGSTSSRDTYKGEPNGCHYGFSDKYFEFITSIATLHSGKKYKHNKK